MRPPLRLKRVLFICVGNCCRSQIAEGFARSYGTGVIAAESAGLAPAGIVVQETIRTMEEKNIDISSHYSKPLDIDDANDFDLLVNISGYSLPEGIHATVIEWDVADPIGQPDAVYRAVRDQLEALVTDLILELRQAPGSPGISPQ